MIKDQLVKIAEISKEKCDTEAATLIALVGTQIYALKYYCGGKL